MRPQYVFISQATSRVVFDLARQVSEELGPTLVLSGNSPSFESTDTLALWKGPAYDNTSYRSRMKSWLSFCAWTLLKARSIEGSPVVLVTSNPPILPMVAAILKQRRGWRFVARILDVFPNAIAQQGLTGESHPVYRAWAKANTLAYAKADAVVTLAPKMGRAVSRYLPEGQEPILIPDWVDPSELRPIPKSENWFVRDHALSDKFVVMYSGNVGSSHDISGLLGAAEQLKDHPRIRFVLIGGGGRAHEFQAAAERLPNCIALPFQPEAAVPFAMAAADLGVVALGRSSAAVSMPSKSYYLMSAGCALLGLTSEDDDLRDLIDTHVCGVYAPSSDGNAVAAAILSLHDEPSALQTRQENARRAAVQQFSTSVCTQKYIELLSRLRDSERAASLQQLAI